MKTCVADYDLVYPQEHLWGVEGYDRVLLLIRLDARPLDVILFGHDPRFHAISRSDIEQHIEDKICVYPSLRQFFQTPSSTPPDASRPISVVICTRDRPQSLARCLKSLMAADYPNFEVIVVDNASQTSDTADVVAATPFAYVREDRPGLDWARNCGVRAAKHDIVAFTDDDVRVDPHWLKGVAHGFANESVLAVTGLILPAELETRAQQLFETYGGMSKGLKPITFLPGAVSIWTIIQSYRVGVGANMAFRRKFFDLIGEFDTALDVGTPSGGGGDLDIFHRALVGGCEVRYEPQALVWHHHRRDMASLRRQIYNNGRAYGVYLIKRWRERRIGRRTLARYILGKWGPWLAGRFLLGLVRRHPLPLSLLWAELWGSSHSTWAYIQTYRIDRRMRRR